MTLAWQTIISCDSFSCLQEARWMNWRKPASMRDPSSRNCCNFNVKHQPKKNDNSSTKYIDHSHLSLKNIDKRFVTFRNRCPCQINQTNVNRLTEYLVFQKNARYANTFFLEALNKKIQFPAFLWRTCR